MESLTIILYDTDKELVDAWKAAGERLLSTSMREQVVLERASLSTITSGPDPTTFDCVVSPANSFGLMGGGVNLALSKAFGAARGVTISHVQKALWAEFFGHQNPGTCLIVDMEPLTGPCRFLAHCPTMRVPSTIPIGSDVVYCCMWSILLAVHKHNKQHADAAGDRSSMIHKLLCSGLGTGRGKVSADACAEQMVLAIKHYFELSSHPDGVPKVWDWPAAQACDDEVQAAVGV